MNRFVQEYGRLVLTIIVLSAFFIALGRILGRNDKNSIFSVQEKKTQTSSPIYSDTKAEDAKEGEEIASSDTFSNLVGDVVESDTAPYFKVKETNNDNQFSITKDAITYNDLFQSVRVYYKGQDVTDKNTVDGEKVKITVLAYSYKPVLERLEGEKNEHVVMEEVDAKDKYGHYIYDENNNRIKEIQPKYSISDSVVVGKNNYIATSDKTCKIRIVYRVQIGSYKAECKVFYIKNRSTGTASVNGLTKVVFSND